MGQEELREEELKAVEDGISALTAPRTPEREVAMRVAAEVLDAYGITGWLRDVLAGDGIELRRTVIPKRS